MHISSPLLYSFSSYLREQIFSSLTAPKKRIIAIAAVALGCLAICYIIMRCYGFKAQSLTDDLEPFDQPQRDNVDDLDKEEKEKQQLGDPLGSPKNNIDVLRHAIHHNPSDACAYYNLAKSLSQGTNVQLLDGKVMTQQQLYLKTLELNPSCASAYSHLANILPLGQSIQLHDGKVMT
jgi:hypothetical protein